VLSFIRIPAFCPFRDTPRRRKPDGNHATGKPFIVGALGQKTKAEAAEPRSERRAAAKKGCGFLW
jgi:hypothetical protein